MFARMERRMALACQPVLMSHPVRWLGLLLLSAAYIQGALAWLFDFGSAVTVMENFGLTPARPVAAFVILLELGASLMMITGFLRWIGALALAVFTILATLVAFPFWNMPPGPERMLATNTFFEHLSLSGGLLLVSWYSLHKWRRGEQDWS